MYTWHVRGSSPGFDSQDHKKKSHTICVTYIYSAYIRVYSVYIHIYIVHTCICICNAHIHTQQSCRIVVQDLFPASKMLPQIQRLCHHIQNYKMAATSGNKGELTLLPIQYKIILPMFPTFPAGTVKISQRRSHSTVKQ